MTGRVTRFRVRVNTAVASRISRVRAATSGAVPTSQTVEPFDVVSLGAGTWAQSSGLPVTPPTYNAPGSHSGDTSVFTSGGSTTTVVTNPHTTFRLVGNVWRAFVISDPVNPFTPVTPNPTPVDPTAMPVGDLPGWVQSYKEDFLTPVAEGGFVFTTNNALATTAAAYPAYYNSMNGNHDGVKDNSGYGEYRPSATFSVANSVLTCRQRVIAGVPVGGHYHPIRPGQSPVNGNYFSGPNPYSWLKFRARTSGSGYGFGFVGFYLSNPWPDGGEYDWPEGSVYESRIVGNHHEAYVGVKPYPVDAIGPAPSNLIKQDWHIYETKWFPGHVQYIVDGIVVNDFTVGVGTQQMAVYFQGVTDQPAATFTANPNVTGSWELDWVVIYDYTP